MEIFRRPVAETQRVQDILYVFSNLTLSEDFTTSFVYVASGVTFTVSSGYTLHCGAVECDGVLLAEGAVITDGMAVDSPVIFTTTQEAFRTMLGGGLAVVPEVSTTKEAFRAANNTNHLEVFP